MKKMRKLSSFFFSKPSRLLREINSNALMVEWSKNNVTNEIFNHRFEMYEYVHSSILESGKIDFMEFGVFQGESLLKWAEINSTPDSRFYGFDTFEGLPETWDRISTSLAQKHLTDRARFLKQATNEFSFSKGFFKTP